MILPNSTWRTKKSPYHQLFIHMDGMSWAPNRSAGFSSEGWVSGRPWNRTGTAEPEPQQRNRAEPYRTRTEPQANPGNRTGKRFLSLSLSLSLALFGALSRSLSRLSLSFSRTLSLSVALFLSRLSVSLSPRPPILPLFGFPARTRPKCGTGRGAKGQIKPILGGWRGPGHRP